MTIAIPVAAALCVAAVLWSESRRPTWEWLFKPLASLCFILLALHAGALHSDYGRWLLAGLVFCMGGDVLLIAAGDRRFLAGLVSFLLGHLLFVAAFSRLPLNLGAALPGLVPAVLLAVFSLRWLWPHVPRPMRLPVLAYVGVISTMLVAASATWGTAPGPLILIGAWGFALSDLAVARHQFVRPGFVNRLWGLPLYYAAQLALAATPTLL